MAKDSSKPSGGQKGIIQRTGKFFYTGGALAWKQGYTVAKMGYQVGGDVAFAIATTSMIVLMPLLFEIAREGQVRGIKHRFRFHSIAASQFLFVSAPDARNRACAN